MTSSSNGLPPFLYHGTRVDYVEEILTHGIRPRGHTGADQWEHTVGSRPDAVYLTTAYPLHFAINAKGEGDFLILEIDTQQILAENLIADEDALAAAVREPATEGFSLMEKARFYRERSHLYAAQDSLRVLGTCAHLGFIPADAVTRTARIPVASGGSLVMGGFDPVITPANYRYLGKNYEKSVAWLFGDAKVCALNPDLARPNIHVGTLWNV